MKSHKTASFKGDSTVSGKDTKVLPVLQQWSSKNYNIRNRNESLDNCTIQTFHRGWPNHQTRGFWVMLYWAELQDTAPVKQNDGNQVAGWADANNSFSTYSPTMAWGGNLQQIIPCRPRSGGNKAMPHQKEPLQKYCDLLHLIAFSCVSLSQWSSPYPVFNNHPVFLFSNILFIQSGWNYIIRHLPWLQSKNQTEEIHLIKHS